MTEIRFYQLQKQTLDQAMPVILSKAYSAGYRTLVKVHSKTECDYWNAHLWTYHPHSFLPHATEESVQKDSQPILLSISGENKNKANMLLVTDGSQPADLPSYDLCCDLFNGQHADSVEQARERWKAYKHAGHTVSYWIQDTSGKWLQKA